MVISPAGCRSASSIAAPTTRSRLSCGVARGGGGASNQTMAAPYQLMYVVHTNGRRTRARGGRVGGGEPGAGTETEGLVAGGGLVALTMALLLRHHGVAVTVVEKRAATSPQPKARRFHLRTMEIFRELGLAGVVRDAARDLAGHDRMAAGRTLAEAGQLPRWAPPAAGTGGGAAGGRGARAPVEVSPELPCLIAQDTLEPVLREAAVAAGAGVRFRTALNAFTPGAAGVSAGL